LVQDNPLKEMTGSWAKFLLEDVEEQEVGWIEKHLRTGRPYGLSSWTARLEKRLGRSLLPRKPGPPKRRSR
jgi:hypothetical protein